jgi:two-component system phosphate regulon response regulator PhoB
VSGPGERVLVVEDDEDTRDVLAYLLAQEGFTVAAAPDGERGLELARAFEPDVVLSDLLMPHLGGAEMAAAMLRDPRLRTVPVVSMSAAPAHLRPPSAAFHVPKPFAVAELVAALRAALALPPPDGAGPRRAVPGEAGGRPPQDPAETTR